jgi:hypothetical protein
VFKDPINVYRGPQGSSAHVSFSQHSFKVNQGEPSQQPLPTLHPPPVAPKASGSASSSNPRPSLTAAETPLVEQGSFKFNAEGHHSATPIQPSQPNNDPNTMDRSNLQTVRSEEAPQHATAYHYGSAFETQL